MLWNPEAAVALARRVLRGYGQVLFCDNPLCGAVFLAATCLEPGVGLLGLVGAVSATLAAHALRVPPAYLDAGIFATNGLLVGLAWGSHHATTLPLLCFLAAASAASALVLAALLASLGARWNLPALSLAFVLVAWVGGAAQDALATALPDLALARPPALPIGAVDGLLRDLLPREIQGLLRSVGSCFFQDSVLAGLLCVAGLVSYSRLAAAAALLGAITAFLTLGVAGVPVPHVAAGPGGFNAVLVALALGGYFLVPSRASVLYAVAGAVVAAVVAVAVEALLAPFSLPPVAAPFNLVSLLFLLPLTSGFLPARELGLTLVPADRLHRPEEHLAWWRALRAAGARPRTRLQLPLFGAWRVSQGCDGPTTHQGPFRHAWDFIVVDEEGRHCKGHGVRAEDFHAFGAPVLAPAAGKIVRLVDGVADNEPPAINSSEPWGNHLVLDHGGEYSELSHFRKGSFAVKEGDAVAAGQVLGQCGNSGRSPEPHVHFQLQDTNASGAATCPAVFAAYLRRTPEGEALELDARPREGDLVRRYDEAEAAAGAAWWPLVEWLRWRYAAEHGTSRWEEEWVVRRDLAAAAWLFASAGTRTARRALSSGNGLLRIGDPESAAAARGGALLLDGLGIGSDPIPFLYAPGLSWETRSAGAGLFASWRDELFGMGWGLAGRHSWQGEEPVRTPAGAYAARVLESSFRDVKSGLVRGRRRLWIAREVGVVRLEVEARGVRLAGELTAFGPGA